VFNVKLYRTDKNKWTDNLPHHMRGLDSLILGDRGLKVCMISMMLGNLRPFEQ